MSDHTTTECLLFPDIFPKPVVAQFDQREGSSDGGALLLKAADRRYGLSERLAACLRDDRQAGKMDPRRSELLQQRVFGIACGYPDANDADRLAKDPLHKLLLGRDPLEGTDLASQPTLPPFENAVDRKQLYRMAEALAESLIERHARRPAALPSQPKNRAGLRGSPLGRPELVAPAPGHHQSGSGSRARQGTQRQPAIPDPQSDAGTALDL